MLKLVNIIHNSNYVSCICQRNGNPEDAFFMKINIADLEIVEMDAEPSIFSRQALSKIMIELMEKGSLPDSLCSYWY